MDNKKSELFEFIELKKQRGKNRKPRYATRKLSIGLVSCLLGFTLLVSPVESLASETSTEIEASEGEPGNKPDVKKKEELNNQDNKTDEKKKDESDSQENKTDEVKKNQSDNQDKATKLDNQDKATKSDNQEKGTKELKEEEAKKEAEELEAAKADAKSKISTAYEKAENPEKTLEDYNKEIDEATSLEDIQAIVSEVESLEQKSEDKKVDEKQGSTEDPANGEKLKPVKSEEDLK